MDHDTFGTPTPRRPRVLPNRGGRRHDILKNGLTPAARLRKVLAGVHDSARAIVGARFGRSSGNGGAPRMAKLAGHRPLTGRGAAQGLLSFVLLVLISLAVTALGFVCYALWPSSPDQDVALDAPSLPITVAGALFNVPPQAIRIAAQRRNADRSEEHTSELQSHSFIS